MLCQFSGMCLCLWHRLVQMLCWLYCLHFGSDILGCLNLWGFAFTSVMGGSVFPDIHAWCISVNLIAVTATSLISVLGTSYSVGYHF